MKIMPLPEQAALSSPFFVQPCARGRGQENLLGCPVLPVCSLHTCLEAPRGKAERAGEFSVLAWFWGGEGRDYHAE